MKKLIVKFKNNDEPKVKNIVNFKKDSNDILNQDLELYLSHPAIEDYHIVDASVNKGSGEGGDGSYISEVVRENHPLPMEVADLIVEIATSLQGCTKSNIDLINSYVDFDLHEKLQGKYGFSGAKRFYTIFKLN